MASITRQVEQANMSGTAVVLIQKRFVQAEVGLP